ncbi:hypothetical protein ONZ45_g15284 [Pleurotus djamor]|nr:hypothetical protein ONZ45_g15284 [Pleurotus djamor]
MSLEPDGGLSSNDAQETPQHISTPGMYPVPHFVNHGTANIHQYNDIQKNQNNIYHYHHDEGTQDAPRGSGHTFTNVMGDQKNVHVKQDDRSAAEILKPSAVKEAAWNWIQRLPVDKCFKDTRSQLLSEIIHWATGKDSGIQKKKVYWLTGAFGIGKSCIAQTLAHECKEMEPDGRLGASFFFSADDSRRNDARKLITTIAYQLCCATKYQDRRVKKVLKADASLPDQDPSTQFQKLVQGPLDAGFQRRVVVIDDFDEGGHDDILRMILDTILQNDTPLRFIITSQLTPIIREFLDQYSNHIHATDLNIQHEASEDIRHFLHAHFGEQVTDAEIDQLVTLSGGLFLFAAVVVKHIKQSRTRRPDRRLRDVLTIDINAMPEVRDRLDELYRRILSQIPQDAYEVTHQLMATICITSGSFSFTLSNLDILHGLESGDAWDHLQYLHAFLYVPGENEDLSYVRLMHRFFREFILDSARSGKFVIDPKAHQGYLATRCLVTLTQGLRRNLRDLPDPLEQSRKNRKTLETFLPQDQISTTVPGSVLPRIILNGALEYACRFWSQNLLSGNEHSSSEALAFLRRFCMRSVLHWVEAMSLLSCMEDALQIMQASLPVVELLDDTSVIQRINTVAKVTQECHDRIFAWPLNVYDLGLIECIHDSSDTIEASTKPLARQPASPNTSVPTTSKPSRPRDTQPGQPTTQPLDISQPPNRLPSPPRSPDGNIEDQSPSPGKSLPKPLDDMTPPPADSPGSTAPPSPRVQDLDVDDVQGIPTDDGSPIPPDSESSSSSPRRGTSPSPQGAPQPHSSPNPRSKPARPIPNTEGNPSPSATPPLSTSTEPILMLQHQAVVAPLATKISTTSRTHLWLPL